MKKYLYIALAALGMMGCSDDTFEQDGEGVGYLRLELGKVNVELSSLTKAEVDPLPDELVPEVADFTVDIKMGGKSVDGFPKPYSDIETGGIELKAGTYTVIAYHGEDEPIQATPYFEGSSTVQINPGQATSAEIEAALANAMLLPAVSENLQKHYSDWTLTVEAGGTSLPLASNEQTEGYLFAKAGRAVNAEFKGTNILGKESTHEWTVVSSTAAQTRYVIQCDPDLSVFSNIQVTATATHTYTEGSLTGTDVALNINANGAPLKLISGWGITLHYNGTLIRTYTAQPEDGTLMTAMDGWPYVPQGSTLSASIFLRTGETIFLPEAILETIPQPEFTTTVSGNTSYSVYLDSGAETANTKDGSSIFDINATASIAPEILDNQKYSNLLKVTNTTVSGQNSGELSYGTSTQFNSLAWQKHVLSATVSFDGVEKTSAAVDCHVTGLPYRAAPPKNTGNNPWRIIQNGAVNYIEFNDTYVLLKSDGSDPIIGSSPFYIPNNINFKLQSKYKKNGVRWDKYEYEVNLLSGNTVGDRICYNDASEVQDYVVKGHQTFTSTNNAISCRFESKTLLGTNANLIYVYIDYE